MFYATAVDSLLMASPLLLLGGIAMAIEFFSGEKGQGARFVTGSLMVCGLVFGGFVGIFILAGGGNVWGPAALLSLFVLPFFAFFGLAGGIFISSLLGRRWRWAIVSGLPLAGLVLLFLLNGVS